ncbi:MAG: homoserine dehydrogenase, partial [Candidatus Latescibacterota bacterium]
MKPCIGIGVIGFGTVGSEVVRLLLEGIERPDFGLELKKVADLDIVTPRGVEVPKELTTTDAEEVIESEEVGIVVELIGGIEPARTYILEAIARGKDVVTANKALLAQCGDEIFHAAVEAGVDVGFEASVGGSM